MSQSQKEIVCRRCGERFPLEEPSCPHCGTSRRGRGGPTVGIILGALMGISAVFDSDLLFFGVVGAIIVAFSAYLLYERRERIHEAGEEEAESTTPQPE